ncbi:restriction endonuclease subunit S [Elizabethkingia anophelis]|uniref:restriction endonuclease subunit S n=1 Tax=Elizabethkingia anophelis TaxID=1117645 RepID=UPI00162A1E69|nr:restriction endonuclease subunit S [Elizabethkingia anophelis]
MRFPSFEGEWEVKKLGEIAEKIGDGLHGTPSYTDESNYYFINGNNLINGKIEITENTKKIDAKTFLKNDKNLRKNTLLISINGTIGNIAKYNNENVMLGKSVGYFNFEENSDFLYFVLQTSPVQEHFKSELTGSTIKNLSLKTLRETNLRLPSQDEQQKVASFLSLIDERITTQSKIINDLKTLKTATAKKIFLQELRLKDDNGNDFPEWEEDCLENVCDIKKGEQFNKEDLNEIGLYPCLNGGISPSGFSEKYNTDENTITISEGGNSCGFVNIMKTKFWLGGHCYKILLFKKISLMYFYQLLKFNEQNVMNLRVGSGLPNIQMKSLKRFTIKISTSESEHNKIANFLSAIDSKIDIESQLLQKLEEQKKFLLQNMFV